jgi:hypothetical protein
MTKGKENQMAVSRWLLPVTIGLWVAALPVQWVSGQGQSPKEGEPAQIVEEIELTRAIIQAERQAIVTRAMDLTAAEAQAFWPLYREYRLEMVRVGDRLLALITTYAQNYRGLSDEMAGKLLTEYLGIEKARLQVKNKYLPRFQKVLPPKKVARYYQVENKLDVIIQAELAEDIPLVR